MSSDKVGIKTCSASSAVVQDCCQMASGNFRSGADTCTIAINNDVFKDCVANKTGERITCDLSLNHGSYASALRLGRGGALAVSASLLLAVITSVW